MATPDNGPYEPWRAMAGADPAAYWHARWGMERAEVERLEGVIRDAHHLLAQRERDRASSLLSSSICLYGRHLDRTLRDETAALGSKTDPGSVDEFGELHMSDALVIERRNVRIAELEAEVERLREGIETVIATPPEVDDEGISHFVPFRDLLRALLDG